MSWAPKNAQWPNAAADIANQTASALSAADDEINALKSRLASIENEPFTRSPMATHANEAASLRNQLSALFTSEAHCLCLHPWVEGVGLGDGLAPILPAPRLTRAIAERLRAPDGPAGQLDAVALMWVAGSLPQLAEKLRLFNQILAIPALQMVQRRAEAQVSYEQDKLTIKATPLNATWQPTRLLSEPNHATAFKGLSRPLSALEGFDAENETPVAELHAILTKKQQSLADAQAALDQLKTDMTGAKAYIRLASGNSAANLADQLEADAPGDEWNHCAALVFVAPAGKLTFLQQAFA